MKQLIVAALLTGLLALPQAGSAAETYDGTPSVELGLAGLCTSPLAPGHSGSPDCSGEFLLMMAAAATWERQMFVAVAASLSPLPGDELVAGAMAAVAYMALVGAGKVHQKCVEGLR